MLLARTPWMDLDSDLDWSARTENGDLIYVCGGLGRFFTLPVDTYSIRLFAHNKPRKERLLFEILGGSTLAYYLPNTQGRVTVPVPGIARAIREQLEFDDVHCQIFVACHVKGADDLCRKALPAKWSIVK